MQLVVDQAGLASSMNAVGPQLLFALLSSALPNSHPPCFGDSEVNAKTGGAIMESWTLRNSSAALCRSHCTSGPRPGPRRPPAVHVRQTPVVAARTAGGFRRQRLVLQQRRQGGSVVCAATAEAGKLISTVEIPAFIPRHDLLEQLMRWAYIDAQVNLLTLPTRCLL